ncbi:TonB-dependent receptor [Aliiglaciecola sp. CAU 1673]|uniref:TonB-dependent receptor n=1 Tax=Aliiglaciecola sp. CAU 1673 TaxID=3032595 RepID=UPI0023DB8D73|nr:TonB-dependent receptor [Aliiglaciecola sp. CAU 1673]MDF2176716.1 TonB-dependent receptor [Aliiglaciecola sp. CAU 1673]
MTFRLLASIALLSASSLYANEIERISVTASRQSQPQEQLSLSLTRLEQEELSLLGQIHISETLSRVPGAWVSRGNGQEHLTAIRSPVLTGAGSCGAFLVLEDGIPTRSSGFCNANQLFEVNTEQAGAIEVLRGPHSALYGSNAVHGTIHILSPDLPDAGAASLALEGGPNQYARVKFSAGNEQILVYGNLAHDGGYQADSGYDQQKLNLVHGWHSGQWQVKSLMSFTNLNQETAGYIEGKDTYKDENLRRQNANPEAYRDAWSWRTQSNIQYQMDNGVTLQMTPFLRAQRMAFLQHFVPWQPTEENGHKSAGLQTQLFGATNTISWLAGMDMEWTDGWLKEIQAESFSPALPKGSHYDYQVIARNLSPFAGLRWRPSEQWQLNAALRYDYQQYDYQTLVPAGSACAPEVSKCRFYRPVSQKPDFKSLSPSLGVVHYLDSSDQLYANLSRGFRAPQTSELFRLQSGQVLASLDTEQLDSVELGWRAQFASLNMDLSAFAMNKRNHIFQDSDRQNVDNGQTRHHGLELSFTLALNAQWQLSADGTFAKHRYANDLNLGEESIRGNDIDTAPRQMWNMRLDWQPATGKQLELEWQHMGRYYLDPQNSADYPGHDVLNLRASCALDRQWRFGLRVLNLLDTDYAERADIGFGQYRYFVGLPRSVYLSLDYRL